MVAAIDIAAIRPSGPSIPEKTLRISMVLNRPYAGRVLDAVELHVDDGIRIEHPFVPQVLWSADFRTVTLLFEPGRVKSGLAARAEAGAPLVAGEQVALLVDGVVVRRWQVVAGGLPVPEPGSWTIHAPAAGTLHPLTVDLVSPIDALARDRLAVVDREGRRVAGTAHLEAGERRWRWSPTRPWTPGRHWLAVHPNLENCCGDSVGEALEHAPGTGLGARRATTFVPFDIARGAPPVLVGSALSQSASAPARDRA